jgi:hypothetical protein
MYDSSVCFLPSAREVAWLTAENSGPGGTLHNGQRPVNRNRLENGHGRRIGADALLWEAGAAAAQRTAMADTSGWRLSDGAVAGADRTTLAVALGWNSRMERLPPMIPM